MKTKNILICVGGLTLIAGIIWIAGSIFFAEPPTPPKSSPLSPAGFQLELMYKRWYKKYDVAVMEGHVKNTSNIPLRSVVAEAIFYDKNDVVVAGSEAMIRDNPIQPGQISPFKVFALCNPPIKRAEVEFKFFIGGTIFTRDLSKK